MDYTQRKYNLKMQGRKFKSQLPRKNLEKKLNQTILIILINRPKLIPTGRSPRLLKLVQLFTQPKKKRRGGSRKPSKPSNNLIFQLLRGKTWFSRGY
jgi:hypothetical protein